MANIIDEIRCYNSFLLVVDTDPGAGLGTYAGINSLAITQSGLIYKKSGVLDTQWDLISIPSGVGSLGNYGSFYDTSTQTNDALVNLFKLNSTSSSRGISIVDNTKITVQYDGVFNIQFSAQMIKTVGTDTIIEFWLLKNGTDIAWTNTAINMKGSNEYSVAAWNFLETANASDYFEIAWHSPESTSQIISVPATLGPPPRPAIPSVIVTVVQESSL